MTGVEFVAIFMVGVLGGFLIAEETAVHGLERGEWLIRLGATAFAVIGVASSWAVLEPMFRW